jgi:hypothetical protein
VKAKPNGYTPIALALAGIGMQTPAIAHRGTFMCKWVYFAYMRAMK